MEQEQCLTSVLGGSQSKAWQRAGDGGCGAVAELRGGAGGRSNVRVLEITDGQGRFLADYISRTMAVMLYPRPEQCEQRSRFLARLAAGVPPPLTAGAAV